MKTDYSFTDLIEMKKWLFSAFHWRWPEPDNPTYVKMEKRMNYVNGLIDKFWEEVDKEL